MLMMIDVITPPHSSSLLLTPPQKSGSNGLYITTNLVASLSPSSREIFRKAFSMSAVKAYR
jgi:hypothetical protein